MKKTYSVMLLLLLGSALCSAVTIDLFEYALNIDQSFTSSGGNSSSPPGPIIGQSGLDQSGFDPVTGLGSLRVTLNQPGSHYLGLFVDHSFDESINTFFNEYGQEYGLAAGQAAAGLSWEIDEPGNVFGNIFDNLQAGQLDNLNGVPGSAPDDVSLGLAWAFDLNANQRAQIQFLVSITPPASSFYLQQTDPDSNASLYFSSTLNITEVQVPEYAHTFGLLLAAVGTLAAARRRTA